MRSSEHPALRVGCRIVIPVDRLRDRLSEQVERTDQGVPDRFSKRSEAAVLQDHRLNVCVTPSAMEGT